MFFLVAGDLYLRYILVYTRGTMSWLPQKTSGFFTYLKDCFFFAFFGGANQTEIANNNTNVDKRYCCFFYIYFVSFDM